MAIVFFTASVLILGLFAAMLLVGAGLEARGKLLTFGCAVLLAALSAAVMLGRSL